MTIDKQYTESLIKNVGRRDFLKTLGQLSMGAAALGLGGSPLSALAAPRRGGRLRVGMGGASISDSLDPLILNDAMISFITQGQLRNNLMEIDHNLQLAPALAESWEPNEDFTSWVLAIRQGVEFHNAKTMTPQDVVFSLNRHRGDTKSGVKKLLESVTDIRVDGDKVIITLDQGNIDFGYVLSDRHFQIIPDGTTDASDGIGTGGYQAVAFEAGVRMLAKRFPNYWKGEDYANFDEVETIAIADSNARMNAIRTGTVDVINRPELRTLGRLLQVGDLQLLNRPSYAHYTMTMHVDVSPFDNLDARLALKYAVDREALVKTILKGYGVPGNDHPVSPIHRFHAGKLPQRTYDPDKARFHAQKAGIDGHVFKLSASDGAFEGGIDAAQLYQETAAKTGIKIEIVREPADGYWSNVWLKKPFCQVFWGGRITEDVMFTTGYAADAAWNDSHWNNERFNQLLIEARKQRDENLRREMYAEMQQITRDDGGVIVMMFPDVVAVASSKLAHHEGTLSGANELDGYRLADRMWFNA